MAKTKAQIHFNMSRVRSKGSLIEKAFERALRKNKIRFRKHVRTVLGTPDFVLKELKTVIFCDSHFWHGYKWESEKYKIRRNRKFWIKKIEANMLRDRRVSRMLRKKGWRVLRFWEDRITDNIERCLKKVQKRDKNGR